jgi:very-short-patch-repair endonuclease
MKDSKLKYFSKLKPFASEHRNNSTKEEIRLWCELLRNGQMNDFRFLRQRPIDKYIVDFICRKAKLIIEVDGYSHQFKYAADLERDRILKDLGYLTLRFTDDEVKNHIQNIKRAIEQALEDQMKGIL